jgi:tRNA 2-thiouridine synthesizing protein C
MDRKRLLFLLRQPPYGTSHALEALESVLVAGVFEQEVSVLFRDDGVWQLASDQRGDVLGTRTVSNVVQALPQYEIENLYVCAASLASRGLAADDLVLPVDALDATAQRRLIAGQDVVIND